MKQRKKTTSFFSSVLALSQLDTATSQPASTESILTVIATPAPFPTPVVTSTPTPLDTVPPVIPAETVPETLGEWIALHPEWLILSAVLLVLLALTVFCLVHYIRLRKSEDGKATRRAKGKVK